MDLVSRGKVLQDTLESFEVPHPILIANIILNMYQCRFGKKSMRPESFTIQVVRIRVYSAFRADSQGSG